MKLFMPERVFFEPSSLKYPLGQEIYNHFLNTGVEILQLPLQSVNRHIPGSSEKEKYARSKQTLVVAVKKGEKLDICKPSADFEFSLISNCPGNCEYCYLQTTQGRKPYLKAYVNLEDIFNNIKRHIEQNDNRITTFEAASMGDPLALEHITGSLGKTIEFFGSLDNAKLRVVTKYDNVDTLLKLKHNSHTRFRFSLNSRYVIETFEHNTAGFEERIEAASKIAAAGYPLGFVIAPIMIYNGWKEEYKDLFYRLEQSLKPIKIIEPITFELIQYRFTATAKAYILNRFPNTRLDMDEANRVLKWGRFGRFKYIYPKEKAKEIKEYISEHIYKGFPDSRIEYFT
jgi:spore photoproduct lyase